MSDTRPEVDVEIPLTPKERAVVNAAMELADGFAAIAHGTHAEAAEHFAEAERWMAVAKAHEFAPGLAGAEP